MDNEKKAHDELNQGDERVDIAKKAIDEITSSVSDDIAMLIVQEARERGEYYFISRLAAIIAETVKNTIVDRCFRVVETTIKRQIKSEVIK